MLNAILSSHSSRAGGVACIAGNQLHQPNYRSSNCGTNLADVHCRDLFVQFFDGDGVMAEDNQDAEEEKSGGGL